MSNHQQTMRAVVCTRYGSPDVLKPAILPKPVPGPGYLLVKVLATAVNSGDVRVRGLMVDGFMKTVMRVVLGFSGPRKPVLGTVFSGEVEETGQGVGLFKAGDEVFGMTGFGFGTFAEYVTIREDSAVALKPVNASHEEAAAIIFGGSTAIHFLGKAGLGGENPGLEPALRSKSVLIYGATGSVGTSAIQIAKYHGATVTAVCSRDGVELARSLGADAVIDYTRDDFTKAGHTYKIIFDAVGKADRRKVKACLAGKGVFKTVGGLEVASETRAQLELLKSLFENRRLKAVIDGTYTLDEIREAHRYVDTGRKKGNVVIRIRP